MSWTHVEDREHVARKRHDCYICGEGILPGTRYVRRFGAVDREFWTAKMHLECRDMSNDWDLMDWETFEEGSAERSTPPEPATPPATAGPGSTKGS